MVGKKQNFADVENNEKLLNAHPGNEDNPCGIVQFVWADLFFLVAYLKIVSAY